jgi:hypothetical protein
LAFSFAFYGLVRKKIAVDAQTGMLVETLANQRSRAAPARRKRRGSSPATAGDGNVRQGKSSLPIIGLGLAFSFAFYGLVRKKIAVDAQTGMLVEHQHAAKGEDHRQPLQATETFAKENHP